MAAETVSAGFTRRAAAFFLEVALFFLTLCLGWYLWLWFTAQHGTTPAKRMLGLAIFEAGSGRIASAGRVWLREVVAKGLLPGAMVLIATPFLGPDFAGAISVIYLLAGLLYPFVAQEHRTTWDYIAGTVIGRRVAEKRPLDQTELRRIDDALPSRRSFVR